MVPMHQAFAIVKRGWNILKNVANQRQSRARIVLKRVSEPHTFVTAIRSLPVDFRLMNNHRTEHERQRFIVIFGKNAMDLEEKLNDDRFVPSGYKVVQMAFNSAQGEFLTILENEWR